MDQFFLYIFTHSGSLFIWLWMNILVLQKKCFYFRVKVCFYMNIIKIGGWEIKLLRDWKISKLIEYVFTHETYHFFTLMVGIDIKKTQNKTRYGKWKGKTVKSYELFTEGGVIIEEGILLETMQLQNHYDSCNRHLQVQPNSKTNHKTLSTRIDRIKVNGGNAKCTRNIYTIFYL